MVAVGALLIGIGAVPPPWAIPRIIRELTSGDTALNRSRTRRRFYDLEQDGYIRRAENQRYEITGKATKLLSETALWNLKIPDPGRWAGTWHLVVFDIPMEKTRVRIPFIRHLQNLGLLFYQRSVWIYPHPLEPTVRKLAKHFGIEAYISFIIATKIDGSDHLKRRFKIKE